MAYTGDYDANDFSPALLDMIVSVIAGINLEAAAIGAAMGITIVITLYLALTGRFMSFLKGFIGSAKKMR
jgi:hypothetical protein